MENEVMMTEQATPTDPAGPKTKPETSEVYAKLVEHCFTMKSEIESSPIRTAMIKLIDESNKVYSQEEDSKTKDFPFQGAENLTVPLTTITVDNMEPRLVAGLVGKEPIVRFEMKGMQDKDMPTQVIETWFNEALKNEVKIKDTAISIVQGILREGTWYCRESYDLREKEKLQFQADQKTGMPAIGQDGKRVKARSMVKEFEGVTIDRIPFKDVFVPDNVGTPEKWDVCPKIILLRPTYAELQRDKVGDGYIAENIGPHLLGAKKAEGQSISDVGGDRQYTGKEIVECIECHLSWATKRDETQEEEDQTDFTEEQIIVTISVESKTVIRFMRRTDISMENNSSIKRMRLFSSESSYGIPMYGKLKQIQKGASDMFNTVINIAMLCMLPWFFYDSKSGLAGEVKLRLGHGVKVDNVDGVKFPEFKTNPAQYLEFMNLFTTLWERLGSIGDWQLGRTNEVGGRKTATEVMSVIQEGNIKHNYQAEILKSEFLDILKMVYDLYFENMDPQTQVTYQGRPAPIPHAMMKRGYQFTLGGSTEAANKYIDRREKEDLFNMLGGDPMINPIKPREEVLKAYGVVDLRQWINPQAAQLIAALTQNPEIMQVVGQYMADKQKIAAEIGGGGGNADRGATPGRKLSRVPQEGNGGGPGPVAGGVGRKAPGVLAGGDGPPQ